MRNLLRNSTSGIFFTHGLKMKLFQPRRLYIYISYTCPLRRGSRGGAPRPITNKQVESCFLNHNLSIHLCCTDSLLMTHRGGLSLSIIIWRIGGEGPSSLLPWGPKILLCLEKLINNIFR
jgi:hypothetical protein